MDAQNIKKIVQKNADLARELSEMKRVANKEYFAIVCKCGKTFLVRKSEAKQVQACPFCGERPWKVEQVSMFSDE